MLALNLSYGTWGQSRGTASHANGLWSVRKEETQPRPVVLDAFLYRYPCGMAYEAVPIKSSSLD